MTQRINKWLYGWKLYVNYGQGWEYEQFEATRKGYLTNKRAYAEECKYPQRWSRGRELNEARQTKEEVQREVCSNSV